MTPRLPFRFGGYGTIIADPPWHYDDQAGRMRLGYGSMSDADIMALPVDTLAPVGRDGHLYVWTTDAHLECALTCVCRWGYDFKRTIVWVKTTQETAEMRRVAGDLAATLESLSPGGDLSGVLRGLRWLAKVIGQLRIVGGHYVRGAHELCLFGTRGLTGLVRDVPSVILAPHPKDGRGRIIHSAKPDRLHEIAERLSPGPRVELFARRARPGWDLFGDQAPTVAT